MQLRASSSFSSVPFSTRSYKQDVFLSFRGEDTRDGFAGHLYSNLDDKGIKTFKDDSLPRGEEIPQKLLRAIEESKLSLIVFSENYATSKWCLDELVHILECRRSMNQMVRPIFYKVDPSDIRNQIGKYGEALAKHEGRFKDDMDKVSRWRTALSAAANLCGWHFKDGSEYKFIREIVKEVSAQVREPRKLDVAKNPVGIDSRVQDMLKILDLKGSDVRMVGIWGTGGIGKSEIAKAVYNKIAREFDVSCFLSNVREKSEQCEGLVKLQNVLLSAIVKEKVSEIDNVDEGITLLPERLRDKRILLLVDDVDNLNQLKKLAGGTDWFVGSSRVIITTRDKRLLIDHQVKLMYEVPELSHHEAVQLFSSKAFKQDNKSLDENEKQLVSTVVNYAQGIPLALEVLGSHLCGASIHKWQVMLDGFRRNHPKPIQKILKVSYDGLEHAEREVLLDIACFFKGWKRNDVIQILEACDRSNPEHSIDILEAKALIYVGRYDDHIRMHDLLEEMGKDKVLQESPKPGKRSRLWHHRDVQDVLSKNIGTSKVEGIMVKMPTKDVINLSPTCFKNMENLKMFINVNGRLCGKVDYLPTQLRLLDWPKCPLRSLPSDLNTSYVVQLNMPGSRISRPGQGFKSMPNLKSLNLEGCKFLVESPDVSGSPNLESLDLSYCKSLVKDHPSVGSLRKLVRLVLRGCYNLVTLPGKVNWPSLQTIWLDRCRKLVSFPEIVGEMKYMTSLCLIETGIKALPSSIRYLTNLEGLELRDCDNFTNLPGSIYELHKLKSVHLYGCPKLVTFPNKNSHDDPVFLLAGCSSWDLDNLALPWLHEFRARSLCNSDFLASIDCTSTLSELDLSGSPIVILSECISDFVNLRKLNLMGCRSLVEIPELPPRIKRLDVSGCVSLKRISKLSNILERKESQIMIEEMDLTDCWSLCQNLVEMADKYAVELNADLFSRLLLSSQQ